jgi:hypothetical protein
VPATMIVYGPMKDLLHILLFRLTTPNLVLIQLVL